MQIVGWNRVVAPIPASVERLKVPIRAARFRENEFMFHRRIVRRRNPGTISSCNCRLNISSTGFVAQSTMNC